MPWPPPKKWKKRLLQHGVPYRRAETPPPAKRAISQTPPPAERPISQTPPPNVDSPLIRYLESQTSRMNDEQREFVEQMARQPQPSKTDEARLSQIYLWLHMEDGPITHRYFRSGPRRYLK